MGAEELSADTADDYGVKPNTWNALVRRARTGAARKLAALTFSSYASPNGRDIKCGVARLAADCEIGYSTARRHLAWMREVGLIELVRPGNHKLKRADEYRLILTPAARECLDIPDEEYRKLVDGVSETNRSGEKGRRLRSPMESADATEPEEASALTQESADTGYLRSFERPSALTPDDPPPTNTTDQVRAPTTGGAPPPDPRRPTSPAAPWTSERNSPTDAPTPAQDQQGESLPRTRARAPTARLPERPRLADVIPFPTETRRIS